MKKWRNGKKEKKIHKMIIYCFSCFNIPLKFAQIFVILSQIVVCMIVTTLLAQHLTSKWLENDVTKKTTHSRRQCYNLQRPMNWRHKTLRPSLMRWRYLYTTTYKERLTCAPLCYDFCSNSLEPPFNRHRVHCHLLHNEKHFKFP